MAGTAAARAALTPRGRVLRLEDEPVTSGEGTAAAHGYVPSNSRLVFSPRNPLGHRSGGGGGAWGDPRTASSGAPRMRLPLIGGGGAARRLPGSAPVSVGAPPVVVARSLTDFGSLVSGPVEGTWNVATDTNFRAFSGLGAEDIAVRILGVSVGGGIIISNTDGALTMLLDRDGDHDLAPDDPRQILYLMTLSVGHLIDLHNEFGLLDPLPTPITAEAKTRKLATIKNRLSRHGFARTIPIGLMGDIALNDDGEPVLILTRRSGGASVARAAALLRAPAGTGGGAVAAVAAPGRLLALAPAPVPVATPPTGVLPGGARLAPHLRGGDVPVPAITPAAAVVARGVPVGAPVPGGAAAAVVARRVPAAAPVPGGAGIPAAEPESLVRLCLRGTCGLIASVPMLYALSSPSAAAADGKGAFALLALLGGSYYFGDRLGGWIYDKGKIVGGYVYDAAGHIVGNFGDFHIMGDATAEADSDID